MAFSIFSDMTEYFQDEDNQADLQSKGLHWSTLFGHLYGLRGSSLILIFVFYLD